MRGFRVLIGHGSHLLRMCRFGFNTGDASLYLIPLGVAAQYFFGQHVIPAGEDGVTAPFDDQERSDRPPHLSIHQSGEVHVRSGYTEAGPIFLPPITDLRGQHVATVTCNRFAGLPVYARTPSTSGPVQDVVLPTEPGVESGRLAVYANAERPVFPVSQSITVTLERPNLRRPFYVGIKPFAQTALGGASEDPSVIVIAGWDPLDPRALSGPTPYLFIVGR